MKTLRYYLGGEACLVVTKKYRRFESVKKACNCLYRVGKMLKFKT